jgi:hypothetical protein
MYQTRLFAVVTADVDDAPDTERTVSSVRLMVKAEGVRYPRSVTLRTHAAGGGRQQWLCTNWSSLTRPLPANVRLANHLQSKQ